MGYGRIEETFWTDDKVRPLSRDARELMAYLLTCRHRNRLGLFVMDPAYASADLRCRDFEPAPSEVEDSIRELVDASRVAYDWTHRTVFIRRYLRHNIMTNQQTVKGGVAELAGLPDTPLLSHLLDALRRWKRPHYKDLIQALADRIVDRWPEGVPELDDPPLPEDL